MLSKHPLEVPRDRRLAPGEVADALRLAVIAELDAINLYLQLARAIDDERVRRVFEDVADEEKTHVGEFLTLLEVLDPRQAEELRRGAEEVKQLTGLEAPLAVPQPQSQADPEGEAGGSLVESVRAAFTGVLGEVGVLRKHLRVVDLGRGAESTVVERVGLERVVVPLRELAVSFRVSQRDLDYSARHKTGILAPELYQAAMRLAVMEDGLIVESLTGEPGVQRGRMSDWDVDGAPVADVAGAVSRLYAAGAPRPYVLIVSPSVYAKLARVSERTGLLELERVSRLVDSIAVTTAVGDSRVIVLSAREYVVDVATGGGVVVDYIGPTDGAHSFRAWELLAVRVKQPSGVVVLERQG